MLSQFQIKIFKYLVVKEKILGDKKDKKKKVYSINIISQYNAQCSAIRDAFREIGYININVNTVVASQGMVNITLILNNSQKRSYSG
jgi:hypothetical protein